jgi:hypothetical protein
MTSTPAGELLTHWTVRVAFGLYVLALAARLSGGGRRGAPARRHPFFRACWTAGCLAFIVHVACAFHFFHGWSHADAYRETARQTAALTGVASGFGLYLNYAFLLAWTIDAAWSWRPARYARRPRWVTVLLHAFFAFMWFNATVVFPTGPTRWAGVAAFGLLAVLLVRRKGAERCAPQT